MCGVGAILFEASNTHPNVFYVGIDVDQNQVAKALSNKHYYCDAVNDKPLHMQFLHSDARGNDALPYYELGVFPAGSLYKD